MFEPLVVAITHVVSTAVFPNLPLVTQRAWTTNELVNGRRLTRINCDNRTLAVVDQRQLTNAWRGWKQAFHIRLLSFKQLVDVVAQSHQTIPIRIYASLPTTKVHFDIELGFSFVDS